MRGRKKVKPVSQRGKAECMTGPYIAKHANLSGTFPFRDALRKWLDSSSRGRYTMNRRWSTLREQSVSLAGGELTNLLFIDDVSLVATGHDRAECLLALLEAYCKATGMAVNAAKCEVLIVGGATREWKRLMEAEYRLGGVGLRVLTGNETARYLGLHYGPGVQFSKFWNSVVKRPGTLCHRAFVADLELALGGVTECWASKVLAFLSSLGAEPPTNTRGNDLIAYYATLELPVESILKVFAKWLDARDYRSQSLSLYEPAPPRGFVTVERLKMSCMFSRNVPLKGAYGLSMMVI
ncbi:hypothetical protein VOLCADRAFT_105516 [Volvox carteri f. nagariensis]|uniref:Reverse transcriptase domain-containing protein n=1 Tax=Volvox carteri f. nagariensis TaxID=3068 RepID=D8U1D1_VOLCA|nr:uncharacterized protein VOLCADRAFT_105516 [Volvox carteri f. nagariensis]EFJ46615.1 hypothetical protein VOLCADRAFT_105516 [Volvox carteri f. nagariensis]|eukprot:XP_002952472.1 hypothetical protein VOLCADRAFT_105516 [Volvox carteri f. nagariensis]